MCLHKNEADETILSCGPCTLFYWPNWNRSRIQRNGSWVRFPTLPDITSQLLSQVHIARVSLHETHMLTLHRTPWWRHRSSRNKHVLHGVDRWRCIYPIWRQLYLSYLSRSKFIVCSPDLCPTWQTAPTEHIVFGHRDRRGRDIISPFVTRLVWRRHSGIIYRRPLATFHSFSWLADRKCRGASVRVFDDSTSSASRRNNGAAAHRSRGSTEGRPL